MYAFPPNRHTLGGTAYLICDPNGNILVDAPNWDEDNQAFLQQQGGVRWLCLTHREAIAQIPQIQAALGCEVVIQEQEAYLLPGVPVTTFEHELTLTPLSRMLWTCGHSPGSSCLYYSDHGGILFSGRHLLPDRQGNPVPLRIAKTFHWRRQIQSVQGLLNTLTPETLSLICPAANTGFLRGERAIAHAYEKLQQLDLDECLRAKPGL